MIDFEFFKNKTFLKLNLRWNYCSQKKKKKRKTFFYDEAPPLNLPPGADRSPPPPSVTPLNMQRSFTLLYKTDHLQYLNDMGCI